MTQKLITVGIITNPSAAFTRTANTTAYASGQLVCNTGAPAPMAFSAARYKGASLFVRKARLYKSSPILTLASFRLHLYRTLPTIASATDGTAWSTTGLSSYIGAMDITCDKAFTDCAEGNGVPNTGSEMGIAMGAALDTLYGVLEARAAYVPISAEAFTVELEVFQN